MSANLKLPAYPSKDWGNQNDTVHGFTKHEQATLMLAAACLHGAHVHTIDENEKIAIIDTSYDMAAQILNKFK